MSSKDCEFPKYQEEHKIQELRQIYWQLKDDEYIFTWYWYVLMKQFNLNKETSIKLMLLSLLSIQKGLHINKLISS